MKKNISAMTLVELIISVIISWIVLLFVVVYISDVMWLIWMSRHHTNNVKNLHNFSQDFQQLIYKFPEITQYNGSSYGIWNDVIVLKDLENTQGIMLWVIEKDTYQLATTSESEVYSEQFLAYRYLNNSQISSLDTSLSFSWANVYENFYVKSLDSQWLWIGLNNLLDMNIEVYNTYWKDLEWVNFDQMNQQNFTLFNFSF
jgi:hypothetical protein